MKFYHNMSDNKEYKDANDCIDFLIVFLILSILE